MALERAGGGPIDIDAIAGLHRSGASGAVPLACGIRRLQPPRARSRARLARRRHGAGARPLSAADPDHLRAGLPRRNARPPRQPRGARREALLCALRSARGEREAARSRRGRNPGGDRGPPQERDEPRRRPHPAPVRQPRRGGGPHELLPDRLERPAAPDHRVQVRMREGRGAAAAEAPLRDLRLFAPRRGRASAVRQGGAGRPALVRPAAGFPHRSARPRQGAAGQERRHRAGGRQGRLRAEAAAAPVRPAGLARRRHRELPHLRAHAAPAHRQHRGRADRAAGRYRPARRRRSLSGRRRRQGDRDVLRHRQRPVGREGPLARRRLRVGRQPGLRPQEDGHHRPRRLGGGEAPLPRDGHRHPVRVRDRGRRRRHVGRRLRQRDAPLPRHQARRRLRPPRHLPRPRSRSRDLVQGTRAPLRPAAIELAGLRQEPDLERRRRLPAQREIDSALRRGAGAPRPRQRRRRRPPR